MIKKLAEDKSASQLECVRAGISNAQGRLYVDHFMSGWLINKTFFFLDLVWQIRNVQLTERSLNQIRKRLNW